MFTALRLLACLVAGFLLSPRPAAAQTITVGNVVLTHCIRAYDGYCGTIQRPLDPDGRVPGRLTIGFELYPHTDMSRPALGTIIAQEGGPGYSTTGSRDGYVRLFTPLRSRRDILLIDKRGTGRSAAITCKRLQAGRDLGLAALKSCGGQLGQSAWLYSSVYAADDVAGVLAALHTGPVDYYGDSYATFFGQVFATRHPDLLRTITLDSAYPVLHGTPYFATEIANGPVSLDRVCARSPACGAQVGTAADRFDALLTALRQQPVAGIAPGINGNLRRVTADPASLFLVIYEVGNNLVAYRDLDAAGHAYLQNNDPIPLLRLVAEAEDGSASGGPAHDFSKGLAFAVMCADYHTLFDMRAPEGERHRQFAQAIAAETANDPLVYTPFALADALAAPTNPEDLDSCTVWPTAPASANPGRPVAADATFPKIPTLVLAGELDTVTSPKEAAETTALFPEAWFVVVKNTGHETAIGDGGVYVPPYGYDLARCAGPIVLHFVATGGDPGDTSCALKVPPIRTVPAFATGWAAVAPAIAAHGNAADPDALRLASAAAETVGDAVARYYVTISGTDLGLRGGRWHLAANPAGYTLHLEKLRWTQDLSVSGEVFWDQIDGRIEADISLSAPGHTGALTIAWNNEIPDARATITGQIDGRRIQAERMAP